MKTVLAAIALLFVCLLLMGVKVLFVKGSSFPRGHAHNLPRLDRPKLGSSRKSDTANNF